MTCPGSHDLWWQSWAGTQVSPTLSPSPARATPPPWLALRQDPGEEPHAPSLNLLSARLTHKQNCRKSSRSEQEAYPVTNKYLLSGPGEASRAPSLDASHTARRGAVCSLAQAQPRWQWQSQDEDPGLGWVGGAVPPGPSPITVLSLRVSQAPKHITVLFPIPDFKILLPCLFPPLLVP